MFDDAATVEPDQALGCKCPRCGDAFTAARRKDQKFCSRRCQQNASRGLRRVTNCPTERRRQEGRRGRVKGLCHAFYETPPAYRAEFLEKLIKEVRAHAELRGLVTLRQLLRSWSRDEGTGRLHIAHVLDHYCQEVYGMRSFVVVNPETELPSEDALTFPAEYFGPDAHPVYEDGSLKVRPWSWAARN